MEQVAATDRSVEDTGASPDSSSDSGSVATTPRQSRWTISSTGIDSDSSPTLSPTTSVLDLGGYPGSHVPQTVSRKHHELLDYRKYKPLVVDRRKSLTLHSSAWCHDMSNVRDGVG